MKAWILAAVLLFAAGDAAAQARTIEASNTITAQATSAEFTSWPDPGGYFLVEITEVGVSQTLELNLQVYDPIGDYWDNLAFSTTFTSTGNYAICTGNPSCTTGVILAADKWGVPLPTHWRFRYDVTNGTNMTFSVVFVPYAARAQ